MKTKKKTSILIIFISLLGICISCRTTEVLKEYKKMSVKEKAAADTLLTYALNHEALYSLLDTLKPMSSVKFLRLQLAKDSTMIPGIADVSKNKKAIDSLAFYAQLCKKLSSKEHKFVLIPFERTEKSIRNIEIYAVNLQTFSKVIRQHLSFFAQFGITEETDPAQVITLIEYEHKYDRWRGYGYLFGYPDNAVDFFVQAGKEEDSTGKFVKRKFFHIPVNAAPSGYFTYAVPQNYQTTAGDSAIHKAGIKSLNRYKSIKSKYQQKASMQAVKLWQKEQNK